MKIHDFMLNIARGDESDARWYALWREDLTDRSYCYEVIVSETHCGKVTEFLEFDVTATLFAVRVKKGSSEQQWWHELLRNIVDARDASLQPA